MNVQSIYHQSTQYMKEELKIIEMAQNDPQHFGLLYKKYYHQILRYIQQRIDDAELAYDVTSQVFIKALTHIHRFEYRGVPFSSWLYRIAKSELYQSFRDKKMELNLNEFHLNMIESNDDNEDEVNQEYKIYLIQSLAALKKHELQLIELRFFEKKSFKEIGYLLDITENNAKVKTFRSLEKLKTIFKSISCSSLDLNP
jgi:RNA polymerase sigma-70 factor (ECF subfamily)